MGNVRFKQTDREHGIMVLMRINLLKRLESSVHSFRLTIDRIVHFINDTIQEIENYDSDNVVELMNISEEDFDMDDQNNDIFSVGKKIKIELNDMDYISWLNDLKTR